MPDGSATALRALSPRQFECPLELLLDSPTDPRSGDVGDLADLDVGETGPDGKPIPIHTPLWVRTIFVGPEESKRFEIIFGHRRTAKARLKGLPTAPIEVHDELDENAVRFLQLREVLQRRDLTPLQHARAYGALRDELHLPISEIAARLHVKERHVHERLMLLTLCAEAQAALREDKIALGVAMELATVADPAKQLEATMYVSTPWSDGAPKSASLMIDWIRRSCHLRLVGSGFPTEDATLVPGAPACSKCPKNTAVHVDMFEGLAKEKDARCLDPACYEAKQKAAAKRRGDPERPAEKTSKGKRSKAEAPARDPDLKPSKPKSLTDKIEELGAQRFLTAVMLGASKKPLDRAALRFLVALAVRVADPVSEAVLRQHEVSDGKALVNTVWKGGEAKLIGTLVQVLVGSYLDHAESLVDALANEDGPLGLVQAFLKIDGAKLFAEAELEVRGPQPETKAKRAAKAAKGKPLPTKAAPGRKRAPITVDSLQAEVGSLLRGIEGATSNDLASRVADACGMKVDSPQFHSFLVMFNRAISKGVKRGTLIEDDGLLKLAEKDVQR